LVWWAGELAITLVLILVCAYAYKSRITAKRVQWQGCPANLGLQLSAGNWKYGICDCCQNCEYCLYGYFCLPCRLGDTYTMTSIGPSYMTYINAFAAVVVIQSVLSLLLGIIGSLAGVDLSSITNLTYYAANACLAYWLSGQRKKLRQCLGDPSPDNNCAMDFICYWFCGCCTAIQEGRQVDEITNTQTKCCFQLQALQMSPAGVGQPAVVMGAPVVGTVVTTQKQEQEQPSGYGGGNYGNVQT
jgi:Cys-rich protein (TIGR01571 family)